MSQLLQIALSTCPTLEKAKEIANILVSEKIVACVNILPVHCSIYEWEGKICQEEEVMMIIKFKDQNAANLENRLLSLHPYDTPEFIILDCAHVSDSFLKWALTY